MLRSCPRYWQPPSASGPSMQPRRGSWPRRLRAITRPSWGSGREGVRELHRRATIRATSGRQAMTYDVVIRGGTVIDGTGAPAHSGDIALLDGRISAVGHVTARGREEIDATGLVVAPGFIDPHTHYDAQLTWDPLASCSSWHGITTIVTGNCGFTLAPSRPSD